MRLLLTGAAGYTGRGVGPVLRRKHDVRGFDIRPCAPETGEPAVGDITDLDSCRASVDGVDAVVFCHMAPNPSGYQTPVQAIDVNVKGTANVYHAMVEKGIRRAVTISTTGVLVPPPAPPAVPGDGPYGYSQPGQEMYRLSKILQECVCRYYFEQARITTTLLRPGWIVYDGELVTKYGKKMEQYHSSLVDPRDIGEAVLAALKLPDPTLEAFHLAQDDDPADQSATRQRLGWRPAYRFGGLPRKP